LASNGFPIVCGMRALPAHAGFSGVAQLSASPCLLVCAAVWGASAGLLMAS